MIPVTKPYLPSQEKYLQYVAGIYQRQWLTNNGPLVQEFEKELKQALDHQKLLFVSNGTIALQLAIKALNLKGEIITTPFSYVATTSSIAWEGCQPVFVDIDKQTLNIDSTKIEEAITENTSAILATHCFGNVCNIEAIDRIAKKHKLKVIYDAAHCFGSLYKGKSVFSYGDISTTSLHATKLIHSVEGGLVFTNNEELFERLKFMRNFGHNGPENFYGIGINGKNSEFHAAMGLCVLDDFEVVLQKRKDQSIFYQTLLKDLPLEYIEIQKDCYFNYAYFPIILPTEEHTLLVKNHLEENEIYPRRYFYPSLSSLNYVKKVNTPISDLQASRILCLPLFFELEKSEQELVCRIIRKALNNG